MAGRPPSFSPPPFPTPPSPPLAPRRPSSVTEMAGRLASPQASQLLSSGRLSLTDSNGSDRSSFSPGMPPALKIPEFADNPMHHRYSAFPSVAKRSSESQSSSSGPMTVEEQLAALRREFEEFKKQSDLSEWNDKKICDWCGDELSSRAYFDYHVGKECLWAPLADSAVSASVYLLISSGEPAVILPLLATLTGGYLLSFLIQLNILGHLWTYLPNDMTNYQSFCSNPAIDSRLQLCAVGAFFLNMGESFNDIFMDYHFVLTSTHSDISYENGLSAVIKANEATGRSWSKDALVQLKPFIQDVRVRLISFCLLLMETLVWVLTLVVGTKYLLVQDNVSNLIQSCVAIVFVNDLDNLVYKAIAPRNLPAMSEIRVKMPYLTSQTGSPAYGDHNEFKIFFMLMAGFGGTPIITCVAVGIVYGLHTTYCY